MATNEINPNDPLTIQAIKKVLLYAVLGFFTFGVTALSNLSPQTPLLVILCAVGLEVKDFVSKLI